MSRPVLIKLGIPSPDLCKAMFLLGELWITVVYVFKYVFLKTRISEKCLNGKTAIVTGGNSGLGYATALALASRGCKVIIADCQNADVSRDRIIASTGNKNVVYKYLDLSSLKSVRNFAADICKTEEKIDILLNNAGIGLTRKLVTEDGLNYVMQVNIFGAFLLTHLLLEPLKKAQSARVLFISSLLVMFNNLTLDTLNITDYEMDDEHRKILYSNSKACCILAAQEFGRRLERFGITANALDPTGVRTRIFDTIEDYKNWILSWSMKVFVNFFSREASDVANHFLCVIAKDNPELTNGENFVLSVIGKKTKIFQHPDFCQDLWSKMEALVGLKPQEKI